MELCARNNPDPRPKLEECLSTDQPCIRRNTSKLLDHYWKLDEWTALTAKLCKLKYE